MFSEDNWQRWLGKEVGNYQLKEDPLTKKITKEYLKRRYLHFDKRFWLPDRNEELMKFLSESNKVAKRTFFPFIRKVVKTPRFRYDSKAYKRVVKYKPRPICYASHFDSLIYSFYSFCLTNEYEKYIKTQELSDCVLAYRTDLDACNIDFAREVFDYIRIKGDCTAIALDVENFFSSLNHNVLKSSWKEVIGQDQLPDDQYHLFKAITSYGYVNENTLLRLLDIDDKKSLKIGSYLEIMPGEKDSHKFSNLRKRNIICHNDSGVGIPQGSPISAILSNIYMINYDKLLFSIAKERGFLYCRYCDDILIVCDTACVNEIKDKAINEIEKYGLKIQESKEEIIRFKYNSKGQLRAFDYKRIAGGRAGGVLAESELYKNLQYLGFEFNGQNTYIRSSSLSRYSRRMKARVSKAVKMAYSKSAKGSTIFKRKIYQRYTHLGNRNFISYAKKAACEKYINSNGEIKYGLDSNSIRKQISKHFKNVNKTIRFKTQQRIEFKAKAGKLTKIRY